MGSCGADCGAASTALPLDRVWRRAEECTHIQVDDGGGAPDEPGHLVLKALKMALLWARVALVRGAVSSARQG